MKSTKRQCSLKSARPNELRDKLIMIFLVNEFLIRLNLVTKGGKPIGILYSADGSATVCGRTTALGISVCQSPCGRRCSGPFLISGVHCPYTGQICRRVENRDLLWSAGWRADKGCNGRLQAAFWYLLHTNIKEWGWVFTAGLQPRNVLTTTVPRPDLFFH